MEKSSTCYCLMLVYSNAYRFCKIDCMNNYMYRNIIKISALFGVSIFLVAPLI